MAGKKKEDICDHLLQGKRALGLTTTLTAVLERGTLSKCLGTGNVA